MLIIIYSFLFMHGIRSPQPWTQSQIDFVFSPDGQALSTIRNSAQLDKAERKY